MPVLYCPRCHRANPVVAVFCHFDGTELRSRLDGQAPPHRLAQEFVFPSGRRCRSFDELAQGCRDEWVAARELLRQGMFKQFFGTMGRADLAKAAQEAMAQADADAGLTSFLGFFPVSAAQAPKLDINPRRLLLGTLLAGEHRQLLLTITNQGQGNLQGTMTVTEGSDWLKLDAADSAQCPISTPHEQKVVLKVDTRGLPAGGTFGAKLTVITNGGAVEVLARMDLVAQPYPKGAFQGARTPRELAERMRKTPKAAGPVLESGEVARWFAGNGWNFPVQGTLVKGVAAVQQFFEAMGLSKPPEVRVSQAEVRLTCAYPQSVRHQVVLQTAARKWVYAVVSSDSPWLKVLTPMVSGPQQATVSFEVDPKLGKGSRLDGPLRIVANAGQTLAVRVLVDVQGAPARQRGLAGAGMLQGALALGLAFLLVRLFLVPFVDLGERSALMRAAAAKVGQPVASDSPVSQLGGWLRLPWASILLGVDSGLEVKLFNPGAAGKFSPREFHDFRHYFTSYFIRSMVLWTWWVGAVVGACLIWMRGGGLANLPWGIVAGAGAGAAGSATLACAFLEIEILPHALWQVVLGGPGGGPFLWVFWVVIALAGWALAGGVLGLAMGPSRVLRRHVIAPVQKWVGGLCRLCGLRELAASLGAG